jgi:vacuolar-type H+-ATPase subunit E/Vma4
MQARYELVEKLRDEVKQRLQDVVKDPLRYQDLIQRLIIQVGLSLVRECSE